VRDAGSPPAHLIRHQLLRRGLSWGPPCCACGGPGGSGGLILQPVQRAAIHTISLGVPGQDHRKLGMLEGLAVSSLAPQRFAIASAEPAGPVILLAHLLRRVPDQARTSSRSLNDTRNTQPALFWWKVC